MIMHSLFVLTLACYMVSPVLSLQNGLARTPPMGWLSWERFRCNTDCKNHPKTCISENLYKDMADRLVEDGYKDVGYEYVNIDDCWSNKTRDADGNLNPNANRFPSGMKALADYIHKKGLKLGIYADYGTKTCAGFPGSLDYLEKDANRFAEWGIDMLKMDGCNADVSTMKKGYPMMTKYLNATGRPILFSCSWPDYERAQGIPVNYSMVAENCNIWRNYVDIQDSWSSVTKIIDYEASIQDTLVPVVGPGNFNDPDMLIVGDFSLSVSQAQAQMALWAVMAAPLLMSNDLRDITPEFREILLNKEVIAVNQDPQGIMGKRVLQIDTSEVWVKKLGLYDDWAIALFNRGYTNATVTLRLADIGFQYVLGYELRDLFKHTEIGHVEILQYKNYTVPATGVLMAYAYPSE